MAAGHRGQPVAGRARRGEPADLAADRLDLRRPVQPQHPTQRDRVDPGRALRAGLAQQRPEHALAQHRIQRVEPVAELAVHLVRGLHQPGRRQRGHRQQQPGQRRPRARREHRRRIPDQPEPRQHPLGRARHRIRQHRHPGRLGQGRRRCGSRNRCRTRILTSRPALDLRLALRLGLRRQCSIGTGWGPTLVGVAVDVGGSDSVADTALRHPRRGGDRAIGRPARTQPADGGHRLTGQLRLAFGAFAFRQQPGHPRIGEPGVPAPQRGRLHRERLGDLELGGGLDPHQRHRREPAPHGVAVVPGVGQVAVHEHPPTVAVLDDRRRRADRAGIGRRQRQRRLRGHHGHPPPLPVRPK